MHDHPRHLTDAVLAAVRGGGTSTSATSFSVQTTAPAGTSTDLRGSARRSLSDREACVLSVRQVGGSAGDIAAVCGPPPAP